MAHLPPSEGQLPAEQPIPLPPITHYEPAIPIDGILISPSTKSTHTADIRPLDIVPNKSSENEELEQDSDEDV